jgi:outer membrane protein OmpA-like peptidoglycan-associated protein
LAFYAHSDGKTFYLLSSGHNTMGGYDLFVTTLENGQFTTPINMGSPLNTTGNESDISMPSSAKLAYMSSNRKDGIHNIYVMSQRQVADGPTHVYQIEALSDGYEVRAFIDEHGITFHDVNMLQLEGLITDITSGAIIANADIMIKNVSTNERFSFAKAIDGTFSIPLPGGNNYELSFQAKGYMYVTVNLDLTAHTGYAEKFLHIQLAKADQDSLYNLIVFFDFDKSDIREESVVELTRLKKFLEVNPTYTIELHGHTDAIGSEQYNMALSLRRTNSIAAWLTKNGISKSRMKAIGYGKSKPIDTNETDAGRQRNRRVEFKIIKM